MIDFTQDNVETLDSSSPTGEEDVQFKWGVGGDSVSGLPGRGGGCISVLVLSSTNANVLYIIFLKKAMLHSSAAEVLKLIPSGKLFRCKERCSLGPSRDPAAA